MMKKNPVMMKIKLKNRRTFVLLILIKMPKMGVWHFSFVEIIQKLKFGFKT